MRPTIRSVKNNNRVQTVCRSVGLRIHRLSHITVSLLTAKLTKRLKSVNFDSGSDLEPASPCRGVLGGGELRADSIPSPPPPPPASRLTRLLPGLPKVKVWPGSMSNVDRKDELSSSGFVLVTVRNVSVISPCRFLGVPFRSSTYCRFVKPEKVGGSFFSSPFGNL
jgi:hypothetical protein